MSRERTMAQNRNLDRRLFLLAAATAAIALPANAAKAPLAIKVYKSPTCGCCSEWVDRLREAGFTATVDDESDLDAIKRKFAVPDDLASCHTGVINGFAIEGHVPPGDIKTFILRKNASLGLAVPGMPTNSPGMEAPHMANEPYTVWEFFKDGKRKAFAKHD